MYLREMPKFFVLLLILQPLLQKWPDFVPILCVGDRQGYKYGQVKVDGIWSTSYLLQTEPMGVSPLDFSSVI